MPHADQSARSPMSLHVAVATDTLNRCRSRLCCSQWLRRDTVILTLIAMASVQLSASSLTPPTARLPQQTRRKACRSLFGPVDHEELNRDLDAKLSEISARDQERWNFNFASGAPLHGDYEWERAAVGATPAFYQEFERPKEKAAAALPPTEALGGVSCAAGGAASPVRTRTGKLSCTKRKTSARLTTTTRITDFYIKRKKRGDLKEREGAPQNPLRFLSAEQTPRKGLR